MNPDKLFDYLDGKLPEHERRALEDELMDNAEARREFAVARRIHAATHGGREHFEVVGEAREDAPRGRRIARQVFLATLVLVGMNVLLGLLYIAHHESKNPNRALLQKQSHDQLQQALEKAAAASLTPPPLGISELKITADAGRAQNVADEVAQVAVRLKGTATKGLPQSGSAQVLVEIPAKRAGEFREALSKLGQSANPAGSDVSAGGGEEKTSILVQVTEAK